MHSSVVHAENNETNCHAAERRRRRFFTGAAAAEKIDRRAAAAGQNDPARRRRNCVVGAGLCFTQKSQGITPMQLLLTWFHHYIKSINTLFDDPHAVSILN